MIRTGISFSMLFALAGSLSLMACDPPAAKPGAADGASKDGEASASAAGSPDAAPTAAAAGESCTQLATKICEAAGEKNPACATMKSATALFSDRTCAVGLEDIDHTVKLLAEAGKACTELADRLCGDLGAETQTCKMVQEQTPNMPAEKCAQMGENYDSVLADLVRMEAKNKPLPAEAVAKIAALGGPSFGPDDATVTVVEFSDFACPYCSRAATAVDELKPQYKDKVRFVFRQFPLAMHADAHLAAQAALAAHEQGKFWEFHDLLFANQKALGRDELEGYAKEIGLDMGAFKAALDDGTHKATVDAELEMGKEVFVEGTPTLFINGVRAANSTDAKSLAAELDKALEG